MAKERTLVNVDIKMTAADGRSAASAQTAPPPMERPNKTIRDASTSPLFKIVSYAVTNASVMDF